MSATQHWLLQGSYVKIDRENAKRDLRKRPLVGQKKPGICQRRPIAYCRPLTAESGCVDRDVEYGKNAKSCLDDAAKLKLEDAAR
jgi:hypothetical protein